MKNHISLSIGSSGQWLAVAAITAGIIIELIMHAHLGYILITSGSFIFAIATKVRYYGSKNVFRNF